jgi:hypothetical protein
MGGGKQRILIHFEGPYTLVGWGSVCLKLNSIMVDLRLTGIDLCPIFIQTLLSCFTCGSNDNCFPSKEDTD